MKLHWSKKSDYLNIWKIAKKGGGKTNIQESKYWKERFASLIKVLPFVLIIIGIMGSLYGGWATPSEAGGLGAVLSLIFVMSIYKIYKPEQL